MLADGATSDYGQGFRQIHYLAVLLQHASRLVIVRLDLEDACAAVALYALGDARSLQSVQLFPMRAGHPLHLQLAALAFLPASILELTLHDIALPAPEQTTSSYAFPCSHFTALKKLEINAYCPPVHVDLDSDDDDDPERKSIHILPTSDAPCQSLEYLQVSGPDINIWRKLCGQRCILLPPDFMSAKLLKAFPSLRFLSIDSGHMEDPEGFLAAMTNLEGLKLHLVVRMHGHHVDVLYMDLPHQAFGNLEALQLVLGHPAIFSADDHFSEVAIDLSPLPKLRLATLMGEYAALPSGIPKRLRKLLVVTNVDIHDFWTEVDLSSLSLLVLDLICCKGRGALYVLNKREHLPQLVLLERKATGSAKRPSTVKR